ncbi:hypothetical protein Tco_1266726, partial [Tanacetum coccineum]
MKILVLNECLLDDFKSVNSEKNLSGTVTWEQYTTKSVSDTRESRVSADGDGVLCGLPLTFILKK